MELIDKDALVAEVERRIKSTNNDVKIGAIESFTVSKTLNSLISFINTLEVKEVDLENNSNSSYKEALKYIEDNTQIRYYESRDAEGFRRGLGMEKEYYVEQYVAKKAIKIAIGYKN